MAVSANSFTGSRKCIGVDVGGTFTDAALIANGKTYSSKRLTTHDFPDVGVMEVISDVLETSGLALTDLDYVVHGTTLATNALIQRRGARTAMLTTAGFRDVIELGLSYRYDLFDLSIDLPDPLVPRSLRIPIHERVTYKGDIRAPLNEDEVLAAVRILQKHDVDAVAICFLHSYINGSHETAAADILRRELPGLSVSVSSEVAPEMREYERFSTTCANAYVQPLIEGYLGRLEAQLTEAGLRVPLLMMLSGGGLADVQTSRRFPVRLVESGPAGGAVFAAAVAQRDGLGDVVSFDMGGTTAKICLIDGGVPQTTRDFEVARVYRFKKGSGIPLKIPVIDMVEIGAGGGSIAAIDELGRIRIGPESAGSEPGPASYARGGIRPTVTDADIVLNRVNVQAFAGGRVALDTRLAEEAVLGHIGKPLDSNSTQAAAAISEMVEENMASAARVHAVESGKDLRNRVLIAFGGAAPIHVAKVMRKLGITRFVVPPAAGVGSAVGFLYAPVAYEIARSWQSELASMRVETLMGMLSSMKRDAAQLVEKVLPDTELKTVYSATMRYVGQGHEINVILSEDFLKKDIRAELYRLFSERYIFHYGRTIPNLEVESVTWSVNVSAPTPGLESSNADITEHFPAPDDEKHVVIDHRGTTASHAVYQRSALNPGARLQGPAVIEEDSTSTLIPSGFTATVLASGSLLCAET